VPAVLVLVLGSAWGLGFSLQRTGALAGVPAPSFAFWSSFGAFLTLLAVNAARGVPPPTDRRRLVFALVGGLLGIAIPQLMAFTALKHLPAGIMAMLTATVPLWAYAGAAALRMERPTMLRTGGTLAGLAGVLAIVLPRASLPEPHLWGWVLFGMLVPILFAAANIHGARHRPPGSDSLALAAGMLGGSAFGLFPVAAATGLYVPFASAGAGPHDWALVGHVGISAGAYILFFEILRRAGVVVMSQTGYVSTLAGIGWGMLIFGETHSAWVGLAAVLILVGLAMVNASRRG
jgi:drug/metabolite transporter (DMT)-like permease